MATFKSVAQKLKAIIDGIAASTLNIKFQYLETMPSKFPAGMIVFTGAPSDRQIDSVTNLVGMGFLIRTVFPVEESQAAAEKWLDFFEALGVELRKNSNQTLSGDAVNLTIEGHRQWATSEAYPQPVVVLDVQVTASVVKSRQ